MNNKKSNDGYQKLVNKATPDSPLLKDCLFAFFAGGLVCLVGELLFNSYFMINNDEKLSRTCVSLTIIAITALLTGTGIYDRIADKAGAGVSVPISGFANSVCAPAIEYAIEGHVLGTSEKMFSLAGAVIVYGCSLAWLYGIIYYFFIGG